MPSLNDHYEAGHFAGSHAGAIAADHRGPYAMPAELNSPVLLSAWRRRALIVCVVATLISLIFLLVPGGLDHILRAYLLGFMLCFSFTGGGSGPADAAVCLRR